MKIFSTIWGGILFVDTQHISQVFPVLEVLFLFLGFCLCLWPKVIVRWVYESWQKVQGKLHQGTVSWHLSIATLIYVATFLICNFFLNTEIVNMAMRFMLSISYITYVCAHFFARISVHYKARYSIEKIAFILMVFCSYLGIILEFLMEAVLLFSLHNHTGILTDLFGSYFVITALFNGFLVGVFIFSMLLVWRHYKRPITPLLNVFMCLIWYFSWVFHHFSLITAHDLGQIFIAVSIVFFISFPPVVSRIAKQFKKMAQKILWQRK